MKQPETEVQKLRAQTLTYPGTLMVSSHMSHLCWECRRECWIMLKNRLTILALADFHGVNIPTMADFILPVWCWDGKR